MIDVILAIVAWKRGWGAKAFIPVAVVFSIGFLLGLAGLARVEFVLGLSLLGWLVLGVMIAKPPVKAEPPAATSMQTSFSNSRA
jgi:hypothetical protein